jgi:dTDP-4-amino-4,6-dideoxygalactose transaminase
LPRRIPFNRPCFAGKEQQYMAEAIERGQISGRGHFSGLCEQLLAEALGVPRVMLTTSCTDALEMAALLLELAPGDEVILPSFTFVSTANAFVLHGGRPVFVDIRPDTLNLDEALLEAKITERTRAIVPVHYGGVACQMDAIGSIARRHGLRIIEDNAHGLFARYRGRPLGSFGDLATQSFHETKNFTCGEGGALVICDAAYSERAEILRDKGTNRGRFSRGQVDKYTWVDLGSSFLPSDLLAAFLYAQLLERDRIQHVRWSIWHRYAEGLGDWAQPHGVRLPCVPPECEPSYHLFHLILPSHADRDALIAHLDARGIMAVSHYEPLHSSLMGRKFAREADEYPVTEDLSQRLVRLPFYTDLAEEDQERTIAEVLAFRTGRP